MTEDIELRVVGLTKSYSPQVTVGPISFEVRKGEFFSLLGPSGCGKTTTLRCIAGFEDITDGSILLGGERLDRRPAHQRDVGLVFQSYALFPHLTVFENVAFGLKLRRKPRQEIADRVQRMLELIDLPQLTDRYPAQLSGGQQQRVAIARSLVLEPPLLMFDEPLSNLDFKLRVQMRTELRQLQQRLGKTSIYVTHDQSEALALSDRIAVLSQGRIEQIGRPQEIYDTPKTEFVADFIGSSNLVPARVIEFPATGGAVAETRNGLRLAVLDGIPKGAQTTLLLLRPERIRQLSPNCVSADVNRFEAKIDEVVYLGEDVQLKIVASGGERLLMAAKGGKLVRHLRAGDTAWFAIDADDIHVLQK